MARPFLQQGQCRVIQGRQSGVRRALRFSPLTSHWLRTATRTAQLAAQPVDVEPETCSTSGNGVTSSSAERRLGLGLIRSAEAPPRRGLFLIGSRMVLVTLASGLSLLLVNAAWASGGTLSGGAIDLFKSFLDQVEAMGPAGSVLFVTVVMVSEMIPLFPTQPLSLASGLIFGGKQGALLMLLGVTLAAVNAFVISRGVGRPLAEKVISMEMGEESEDTPGAANHNAVARKLAEVQRTIETGTFWQQLIAVALLRLTPVVPFSASNYVLGLTPLQLPAFVAGTVAGMTVWAVLYASLGGAGRGLLDSGVDMGTVLAELAERSSAYTRPVLLAGSGVAAAAVLVYLVSRQLGRGGEHRGGGGSGRGGSSNGSKAAPAAAAGKAAGKAGGAGKASSSSSSLSGTHGGVHGGVHGGAHGSHGSSGAGEGPRLLLKEEQLIGK